MKKIKNPNELRSVNILLDDETRDIINALKGQGYNVNGLVRNLIRQYAPALISNSAPSLHAKLSPSTTDLKEAK